MAQKKISLFEANELQLIKRAFNEHNGILRDTAAHLGLTRPRMLRKLRKYGLYKPLRRA